ncbi:MAG: peroxiredoxin family protein [Dermatophilaceae bacterium]
MTTNQQTPRQPHLQERRAEQQRRERRQLTRRLLILGVIMALVGLVGYGLWRAQPTTSAGAATSAGRAATFSLKTTAGTTVSLSDFLGKPVILYFNEGAGCGSCTQQMAQIEKNPGFAEAGITVLPIVMNTTDQIRPDLQRYGVKTPYLLDDGTVSKAYGTLGKGMHEGLPGHGFVLIDKDGVQRWQGNYPSMWLDPAALLNEAKTRL